MLLLYPGIYRIIWAGVIGGEEMAAVEPALDQWNVIGWTGNLLSHVFV